MPNIRDWDQITRRGLNVHSLIDGGRDPNKVPGSIFGEFLIKGSQKIRKCNKQRAVNFLVTSNNWVYSYLAHKTWNHNKSSVLYSTKERMIQSNIFIETKIFENAFS